MSPRRARSRLGNRPRIGRESSKVRSPLTSMLIEASCGTPRCPKPAIGMSGIRLCSRPDAKNKLSKLNYWRDESPFASWSLIAILPADLLRWRRQVLDEDNAEVGETTGPEAEVGPQTVIHRLNVLSQVYNRWALAHSQTLSNPVIRGVRPSKPDGRNRRLSEGEEEHLLHAARASTRPWLEAAIIISLETCIRQSELAGLTWDRVNLSRARPYADLLKTKNGEFSSRCTFGSGRHVSAKLAARCVLPLTWGSAPYCRLRQAGGLPMRSATPSPTKPSPASDGTTYGMRRFRGCLSAPKCATPKSW